jgi:succinate dehydrogenase/fumarate reductase-like Fe-S protein
MLMLINHKLWQTKFQNEKRQREVQTQREKQKEPSGTCSCRSCVGCSSVCMQNQLIVLKKS